MSITDQQTINIVMNMDGSSDAVSDLSDVQDAIEAAKSSTISFNTALQVLQAGFAALSVIDTVTDSIMTLNKALGQDIVMKYNDSLMTLKNSAYGLGGTFDGVTAAIERMSKQTGMARQTVADMMGAFNMSAGLQTASQGDIQGILELTKSMDDSQRQAFEQALQRAAARNPGRNLGNKENLLRFLEQEKTAIATGSGDNSFSKEQIATVEQYMRNPNDPKFKKNREVSESAIRMEQAKKEKLLSQGLWSSDFISATNNFTASVNNWVAAHAQWLTPLSKIGGAVLTALTSIVGFFTGKGIGSLIPGAGGRAAAGGGMRAAGGAAMRAGGQAALGLLKGPLGLLLAGYAGAEALDFTFGNIFRAGLPKSVSKYVNFSPTRMIMEGMGVAEDAKKAKISFWEAIKRGIMGTGATDAENAAPTKEYLERRRAEDHARIAAEKAKSDQAAAAKTKADRDAIDHERIARYTTRNVELDAKQLEMQKQINVQKKYGLSELGEQEQLRKQLPLLKEKLEMAEKVKAHWLAEDADASDPRTKKAIEDAKAAKEAYEDLNAELIKVKKSYELMNAEATYDPMIERIKQTTDNIREQNALNISLAQAKKGQAAKEWAALPGQIADWQKAGMSPEEVTRLTIERKGQIIKLENEARALDIERLSRAENIGGMAATEFKWKKDLFDLEVARAKILPTSAMTMINYQMRSVKLAQDLADSTKQLLATEEAKTGVSRNDALIQQLRVRYMNEQNEALQKFMDLAGGTIGMMESSLTELNTGPQDTNFYKLTKFEIGDKLRNSNLPQGLKDVIVPMLYGGEGSANGQEAWQRNWNTTIGGFSTLSNPAKNDPFANLGASADKPMMVKVVNGKDVGSGLLSGFSR